MGSERSGFEPGKLRVAVEDVTRSALASGALVPIPTGHTFVEEGGVRFFVRVLASLARKDADRAARERAAAGASPPNPFLPYEERLFVADVAPAHAAILNKFNVVDHHLLIVTRAFEDQRSLLTPADFEAWWRCLVEYPSLGFYNGGVEAGASQPHKHLQLVPLPLAPEGPAVPVEPLLARAPGGAGASAVSGFGFRNVFARLGPAAATLAAEARRAWEAYRELLAAAGLRAPSGEGLELQSGPYCLLATREWMLLVPRSREFFGPVSVNSLGFAGSFFVRDEEQLGLLRRTGPLAALRGTAFPA